MRSTIVVDRRVGDFPADLGDPHSLMRWDRSVAAVEVDNPGPLQVGSTFATIGPPRGRLPGTRSEYRVLELEPRRNRVELLRHPLFVTAIWSFEYEPRGAGTEVTCSVDATMKRRWVLLLPALRRARKALAGDLIALKTYIEEPDERVSA
jgi:hypothetical protein